MEKSAERQISARTIQYGNGLSLMRSEWMNIEEVHWRLFIEEAPILPITNLNTTPHSMNLIHYLSLYRNAVSHLHSPGNQFVRSKPETVWPAAHQFNIFESFPFNANCIPFQTNKLIPFCTSIPLSRNTFHWNRVAFTWAASHNHTNSSLIYDQTETNRSKFNAAYNLTTVGALPSAPSPIPFNAWHCDCESDRHITVRCTPPSDNRNMIRFDDMCGRRNWPQRITDRAAAEHIISLFFYRHVSFGFWWSMTFRGLRNWIHF